MPQNIIDNPKVKTELLITDLGMGNAGSLGPESQSDLDSVNDIADPKYIEQMRAERWFCMDDGVEELGGQLPGGVMVAEVANMMMNPSQEPRSMSRAVAEKTQELVDDGVEVWVHGDAQTGKEGCAANKFLREILRSAGQNADVIAPTVWSFMEVLGVDAALERRQVREFIDTGAERAKDNALWDLTATEVADMAVDHGAKYQELNRIHKTACTRIDLTPNIFDNHNFRKDHKTEEGDPLGALSITLGQYRDSLVERAKKQGYDQRWVAENILAAAIFSIGSAKVLGNSRMRLAVVTQKPMVD